MDQVDSEGNHIMRHFIAVCAALLLAGCGSAREAVYSKIAEAGNRYCDTRDQATRDALINRVNQGIRDNGGNFTFDGVTCDKQ